MKRLRENLPRLPLILWRLVLLLLSIWLFILAITLMKEGARELGPFIQRTFSIQNVANSLGFGWLFAYGVMSGSPVAAAALTFFDAHAITDVDAFAMITGSRLGASLIVLLIGFIYVLRGRGRSESLGIGLMSLSVTGSTYLGALAVGYVLLSTGSLDWVQFNAGAAVTSVVDGLFGPVVHLITGLLPGWLVFLVGMGVIITSFKLFDTFLPTMSLRQSEFGRVSRLVYRPVVMFILGSAITLLSMSVSVSLSLLVPLSNRGFVRRENVIPYIMGANITTFIDTLVAAILLQNPRAFTVVFVEMFSIALVSAFILLFFFDRYERTILRFVNWLVSSNRNLAFFIFAIFLVPVILLFI